ncbi:MAG: murein hydrolase activator EnvC family protein [Thermacetogeniaceae bacterium]
MASLLLTVVLSFSFLLPGWADELANKKQELERVNRLIQQNRQKLQENKRQQQSVLAELELIDRDLKQTNEELEQLTGEISSLQASIDEVEKKLDKAEADLQRRTEILHDRLRHIYTEGDVSFLEVLLQAESMTDFLTRFDLMQRIAEQDMRLMKELAAERDAVKRMKEELEAKRNRLVSLQQATREKQTYLAARSEDRKQVLKQLESEREAYERALNELEATSRQLTRIIQQLQAKNSSPRKGTGRFIWPASGPITSGYGMRYHPILQEYRMHTGIDIGAAYGARVVAADGGTVIYTGWLGGYGQVVVIDHGGGISTLYAHLSSIAVSTGSTVQQGQTIGYVGSTGWSTGPHLHFEVRVNGEPQNPLAYL